MPLSALTDQEARDLNNKLGCNIGSIIKYLQEYAPNTDIGAANIADAAVTLAKMSNLATKTYIGRTTAGTGVPEAVAVATVKTDLSLGNVDNTSDLNKPVSTAQGLINLANTLTPAATGAAISVASSGTMALILADTGETNTLAIPTFVGQQILLSVESITAADTRIVTSAQALNATGNTTITFALITDWVLLVAVKTNGALRWRVAGSGGVVLG